MSTAVLNALKIVQTLSRDEQYKLIELVEEQLPEEDLGLDPEFIADIQRRSDEIDAGVVTGRSWSEIRREMLAEIDNVP